MANPNPLMPSSVAQLVTREGSPTQTLLLLLQRILNVLPLQGNGSPENVVTASPGKLYTDNAGGVSLTLYVKESGVNTNTGWIAK